MPDSDYKLLYNLLIEQIKDNALILAKPEYRQYPAAQAMRELLSYGDGLVKGLGS